MGTCLLREASTLDECPKRRAIRLSADLRTRRLRVGRDERPPGVGSLLIVRVGRRRGCEQRTKGQEIHRHPTHVGLSFFE
jgi:hypothetical protein